MQTQDMALSWCHKAWPAVQMAVCSAHAASRNMHQQCQHGQGSLPRLLEEPWRPGHPLQLHGRMQDSTRFQCIRCLLCRWQHPCTSYRRRPQVSALPVLAQWPFSLGWRMRRREWRLSQRLEASCPKEFKCPISLDIMQDPIILVRPVQQHLTEATHPLLEQEHCPLQCTLRAPVDATV